MSSSHRAASSALAALPPEVRAGMVRTIKWARWLTIGTAASLVLLPAIPVVMMLTLARLVEALRLTHAYPLLVDPARLFPGLSRAQVKERAKTEEPLHHALIFRRARRTLWWLPFVPALFLALLLAGAMVVLGPERFLQ